MSRKPRRAPNWSHVCTWIGSSKSRKSIGPDFLDNCDNIWKAYTYTKSTCTSLGIPVLKTRDTEMTDERQKADLLLTAFFPVPPQLVDQDVTYVKLKLATRNWQKATRLCKQESASENQVTKVDTRRSRSRDHVIDVGQSTTYGQDHVSCLEGTVASTGQSDPGIVSGFTRPEVRAAMVAYGQDCGLAQAKQTGLLKSRRPISLYNCWRQLVKTRGGSRKKTILTGRDLQTAAREPYRRAAG